MAETRSDGDNESGESSDAVVVHRRHRWRRIAGIIGLSLLLLILVAIAAVWIARRPIASNVLDREFERRGVQATYDLDRVGLRTQVIRNLVIGDPQDPDLVARYAMIQLRVRWNGSVEVYRVVARGVRLEGRIVDGRVVWGDVSKLLPPPTDQPFEFPDIVVDVADSSISLQTPFGPLGFAIQGSGNLTGGFEGQMAAASPGLNPGRCSLLNMNGLVAIGIVARRPNVVGPVSADRFVCPESRLMIDRPRLNIESEFNESFTRFDGRGQMAAQRMIAGENALAQFLGNISFEGTAEDTRGEVDLAAMRSRLGPISADRTRVTGDYRLSSTQGTFVMNGNFGANSASLGPSMIEGVLDPLQAAAGTPLGPITTAMARAIRTTARNFNATGAIRVINAPGGGMAQVGSATIRAPNGARARLFGGEGVTYQWPAGRMRIDGRLQMGGGGLPTGEVVVRQPRPGGPISGVARFQPYRVGSTRLALEPIRFETTAAGATEFSTVAQLDGPFADGAVRGLILPISGRMAPDGSLLVGRRCIVVRWTYFRMSDLELGPTRLPVCPVGPAIIVQPAGGELQVNARVDQPRLQGRLGGSSVRLDASSGRVTDSNFVLNNVDAQLGAPQSGLAFEADRLQGSFAGEAIAGTFTNAQAIIGNVPLLLSNADAQWRYEDGNLTMDGAVTVSDRHPEPRFYPLRSTDFSLTMSGNDIRAGGTLRHPASGTRVTDVTIRHDLGTGEGGAILDVPGLTFGPQLQPEELTRLSEGVIALVEGTVRGQGRIFWDDDDEVTSSGEFTTVNMDLAAPFGPVEDLTTTIRFTDLLGLETAPGQVATVGSINPGIPVEDGVITYQLLPNQRVRVQRGVWPFMGGTLILHETTLNFARPTPKRLTFEVIGLDAAVFVESLGFDEVMEVTGIFDGVLPMIFDDAGGRIVGGRLDSRPPGGMVAYRGGIGDPGLIARLAINALRELHYRDMVIRLNGELDGEFETQITIDHIALGQSTTAGILRALTRNLRFKFNITITGPLRSVIQTMSSLEDPTQVIAPVLPFPIDSPALETEARRIEEETEATQPPTSGNFEITTDPPTDSER